MVTLQLTPVLITARRSARSKLPLIISYNFPSLSTKDCIWRHFVLSISTAFWFLSENLRVSLSHLKQNIYNMDNSLSVPCSIEFIEFFYNVVLIIPEFQSFQVRTVLGYGINQMVDMNFQCHSFCCAHNENFGIL